MGEHRRGAVSCRGRTRCRTRRASTHLVHDVSWTRWVILSTMCRGQDGYKCRTRCRTRCRARCLGQGGSAGAAATHAQRALLEEVTREADHSLRPGRLGRKARRVLPHKVKEHIVRHRGEAHAADGEGARVRHDEDALLGVRYAARREALQPERLRVARDLRRQRRKGGLRVISSKM